MRRSDAPRRTALGLCVLLTTLACGRTPVPPPDDDDELDIELAPTVHEARERRDDEDPPPTVAAFGAPPEHQRPTPTIVPAGLVDRAYANEETISARRYVYRVRMVVPEGLGSRSDPLVVPAAELFLDVDHERLRARFAGSGWPLMPGTEVRLRRDRPGAYVFDGAGGRPLLPGELASLFDGGRVSRRGPPLRVYSARHFGRRAPPVDPNVPGELVCALLAEWSGESREPVLRRCERGPPHHFRLGFWRAEQTAGVPVDLARSSLRADHGEPPRLAELRTWQAYLEPAALARIAPDRPEPDPELEGLPALVVENRSANRVIVTVEGIAVGWVDVGADARFEGFAPGSYRVGAIRPLGAVVQRARAVRVPGTHRVCDGRCR